MDDLNQKILNALKDESNNVGFSEENANALQLIKHSFKGTFRLTFFAVLAIQLIFAGLAAYCTYYLIQEVDIAIKLNWLAGAILTAMGFAIARIVLFMELNRLSVIREVKRVELQVSLIAEQVKNQQ